jgi:hypothetical protein
MAARHLLLDGLARDADTVEVLSRLAVLHPRNDTFPGQVFLHLAGDALERCGASRAEPLPLQGLCERFLSEATFFRGRQNAKLQWLGKCWWCCAAISGIRRGVSGRASGHAPGGWR